jgi:hypothetical protein
VCPALQMPEPMVTLPVLADLRAAHDPLLQRLDQGDVLALVRRKSLQLLDGGLSSVSQVRIAPWETWPPVFQPPLLVLSDSWNVPFVSSVEPIGTFAIGVEPFPKNNPSGCVMAAIYGLSPDAPPGPNALALSFDGKCDDAPISVATAGDGTHFVANDLGFISKDMQPVRGMVAHVLDASGKLLASPEPFCASGHFVGDVLSDETGFLFVHSSTSPQSCSKPSPPEPARQLLVRRFDGVKEETSLIYEGTDELVYARILPRNGGSWVFFRESGASALIQPEGMARRLEGGKPSGEAFPVTPAGSDRMAAATLGDGFVVAFVDNTDPTAPLIFVRVFSESGTLVSEAAFSTSGAWLLGDRLTLVGSPDARSFLVGWTGATEPSGTETFLRRFNCIDHE